MKPWTDMIYPRFLKIHNLRDFYKGFISEVCREKLMKAAKKKKAVLPAAAKHLQQLPQITVIPLVRQTGSHKTASAFKS